MRLLPPGLKRVLITTDAVGGVSRYASDLADGLRQRGVETLLAGFGPRPGGGAIDCGGGDVVWTAGALDWLVDDEAALDAGAAALAALARDWQADLVHVNAPSQAAGLAVGVPVVAAAHSCVPTWQRAVRGEPLAESWSWHMRRNRAGFDRADVVLAPSASHAAALRTVYGAIEGLAVVHNATGGAEADGGDRDDLVLAAGRWWDAGKGAGVLDAAAAGVPWPVAMAGPLAGPAGQGVTLENARALGTLPPEALRGLMSRAAIFAAPSLYEPFGLAVLEAAARGCALALSDIPTFRELWDGAAVFVNAADPLAWSDALGALADDAGRRARIADAARARARAYTPARQLAGILDAYAAAGRAASGRA